LWGRTVAARKPEAKRNEEQRRRARARIHGKYKAVGADLFSQRTHEPGTRSKQQHSGMDPPAPERQSSRLAKTRKNAPPHRSGMEVGIGEMEGHGGRPVEEGLRRSRWPAASVEDDAAFRNPAQPSLS